ncbi:MAG: hypothetical protein V2B20_25875 [Pseudomonadota bacterium]
MSVIGTASEVPSTIGIRLDSGHGLNGYEWERYPLQHFPTHQNSHGIPVIITRTGIYNTASLGAKVVLRNIIIDQKKYFPSDTKLSPGIELKDGSIFFTQDGASLQLNVKAENSLQLEFPVANNMGMVDVQIGEQTTRKDLYAGNDERQWAGRYAKFIQSWFVTEDGRFTINMPMPRYSVNTLRVESKTHFSILSATIKTADGETLILEGSESPEGFDFPMTKIYKQLKRHFHPDRLCFQIIFALLSTWILSNVLTFALSFHDLKEVFFDENRYIFWLMLCLGCMFFSFWHIAFWPGITSNDSLEIWRAAQIPGTYLGDHPPLNVIFYLYLSQFWNNVAIVPFVQNLLTSLLIAYIFFSLFRKGMPLSYLLPFYALVAFSLPVGLYTIVLWKDVPFALIVVFVGFKLAFYYLEKRNKTLHISKNEWFSLVCLTLALAGFRHNGVLYLVIVPFIILLFGIVRIRPRVLGVLFSVVVIFGTSLFLYQSRSKSSNFLIDQTKVYLNQAIDQLSFDYLEKCGKKYLGIFDVNQKDMQWDLVHLCAYGRYTNDFLRNLRWNDVYSYLPLPSNKLKKKFEKAAWAVYWKSYKSPWVYFSWNPVYMLVLLPLLPFMFRKLPMTSVFCLYIFIPTIILVFLNIFNWRYYYFVHLACYFILPLIITDCIVRKKQNEISC